MNYAGISFLCFLIFCIFGVPIISIIVNRYKERKAERRLMELAGSIRAVEEYERRNAKSHE